MAVLALYLLKTLGDAKGADMSLSDYLNNEIFAGEEGTTVTATDDEIKGFDDYMKVFNGAKELEQAAINVL